LHLLAVEHLARDLAADARGELAALLRHVPGVADVRRQVAELAGERDAGGNGLALRQRLPVAAADGQGLEAGALALLVLGAEGRGVAVAGVVGGNRGLADVPGRVAAGDLGFRQREQGLPDRAVLERARGV